MAVGARDAGGVLDVRQMCDQACRAMSGRCGKCIGAQRESFSLKLAALLL